MKNKKINVLVLGVGGNVSQGIVTAIKHSELNCNILGACISPESLGLYFCDKAFISPYASDPNFTRWVSDLCKAENIDIVLSGVEENIVALEKQRKNLKELGIPFFGTPLHLLEIGNNKLKTCEWLKNNGLNYPRYAKATEPQEVEKLIKEVGFPLIAKPIQGKGSQGIFKINSQEQLKSLVLENYVLQEIIGTGDQEYTVGCYIDKNKNFKGMIIMQRWLKHGTTFKAMIVENDAIRTECERICEKFKAEGPLNIQLRMQNGKPVCFELNVRFSGTTPLRANWGFNDVEAFINEHLFQEPVSLSPQKYGLAYRYYNEAYVDERMLKQLEQRKRVLNVNEFNNNKESE